MSKMRGLRSVFCIELVSLWCSFEGVMETSNEKQAIRIADLGVEQLTFLQRQLDQEITFLTESLKVSFSKLLQLSNWPKYAIYRPNELLCNAFLNCALSEISGTLCEISKDYTVCAYFSQR